MRVKRATKQDKATLAAFVVAPIAATIADVILSVFQGIPPLSKLWQHLPLAVLVYVFSLYGTVLFGLPTYLLLNRAGLIKWWTCLGTGAVIGVLYGYVLVYPNPLMLGTLLTFAAIGVSAALTFWLIWRQGREVNS